MKHALIAFMLFLLTGCASMRGHEGTAADVTSTAMALQVPGVVEANPLALVGLPIRIAIVEHAKTLPPEEGKPILHASRAVGWGAAANNVLVALGAGPAAAVVGIATGLYLWNEGAHEREFWRICAAEMARDPRITKCVFSHPATP